MKAPWTRRDEDDAPLVFAGSASPNLTRAICDELGVALGRNQTLRFSDGNLFVRVLENVRGRSVYIVQSTAFPANANFMELLFWLDAFRRASADSVTAVVPYFSYAKGDKKDEPRVSIRARVCADAIEAAGADRVVCMDLHAPQIQGFFRAPGRRPVRGSDALRRDPRRRARQPGRRLAGRRLREEGQEHGPPARRAARDRRQGAPRAR